MLEETQEAFCEDSANLLPSLALKTVRLLNKPHTPE